jgi:hypothetical protein
MASMQPSDEWCRRWIALATLLIIAWFSVWVGIPSRTGPGRTITIQTDASGFPILLGVRLGDTNLQYAVFRAMRVAGVRKVYLTSPGLTTSNLIWKVTNMRQATDSIRRAGL